MGLFNRSLEATVTDHYEFLDPAVSLASKLNLNISLSLTAMALPQKKSEKNKKLNFNSFLDNRISQHPNPFNFQFNHIPRLQRPMDTKVIFDQTPPPYRTGT